MELTDRQRQAADELRTDDVDEFGFDLPARYDGRWCKVTVDADFADQMQAVVTVEAD